MKPPSPLQPLIRANVKPPSPMLAPKQRPLKPPSPLQPKNAPKTPISHPQRRCRFQPHTHTSEQRRWRFQLRLGLREQRRWRFHARDFRCTRAMAGPGRASSRRTEPHISDQAPPVWRAPEGPEGTGGLRGAAPNEVRSPSLAGGRALRRPEHQRRHKHKPHNRPSTPRGGHRSTHPP